MAIVVGGRIITTVISSQYLNRLRVISSIKQENQNEESQIQNVEPQTSELNDQPKQPQTKQPSKPTSQNRKNMFRATKLRFNLNTRYVIETDKFNFYNLPEVLPTLPRKRVRTSIFRHITNWKTKPFIK